MPSSSNKMAGGIKLIFSIVAKGLGSKVIEASRFAGAEGGTVVPAMGTEKHGKLGFLDLAGSMEKEVVMTMTGAALADTVLDAITKKLSLEKPGKGIAFALDLNTVIGISHMIQTSQPVLPVKPEETKMEIRVKFNLIVAIMKQESTEEAVAAARQAGAEGATILHGRGAGIHENARLLNIPIEPEKDVLLILTPEDITDSVLQAVTKKVHLDQSGHGIAFVLDVDKAVGICHLYNRC